MKKVESISNIQQGMENAVPKKIKRPKGPKTFLETVGFKIVGKKIVKI